MRTANQISTSAETVAIPPKISRQSPKMITISWPKAGASTGTTMKVMKARLITRAIARPAKQSRTSATVTTRPAATAAPLATRAASSSSKLPEKAATTLVTT